MYRPKAEIHLARLRHNFKQVADLVGGAKVLAVVKANGYGHGLTAVARALAETGCYGFGVALLSEAVSLREAGINRPILHLGRFDKADIDSYLRHGILMSIHSEDDVHALADHHQPGREYKVHLKVDTGMTRLGVPYEKAVDILERLKELPFIHIEGIWSHLATSDAEDTSYMTYQLQRFSQFVHVSNKLKIPVEFFHLANSGAIIREPRSHFNMVRPGIILFGVLPSEYVKPPFKPQPVMDLKAPLVRIRTVAEGTPVGYGRTYNASRRAVIGTLQIGYADGVPVSLSNEGHVQIGGDRARMAGRVSMDLLAVILGQGQHRVGDEALIWGMSGDPSLSVEQAAKRAGTIPYELLTRVGIRVERIYV